jgi:oxygen-dependent protoporphyrinogen oxidase
MIVPGGPPGGSPVRAPFRVAVIGAGIAGLAAAAALSDRARDHGLALEVAVYEAGRRAGGHILTEKADGFLIEGGPDCFVSQKPWGMRLAGELGLAIEGTAPVSTTYVLSGGRLYPLPEGTMLMVPTRFLPLARSGLLSWPGKLRMGLDLALPRGGEGDESLGDFVRRRLGDEALETIAEPLVAGVHAGDPDRLSLVSTFPRFKAMETDHRSLIVAMVGARRARAKAAAERPAGAPAPPTAFVTVAGGLEGLIRGLVDRLPAGSLHLGAPVTVVAPAPPAPASGTAPYRIRLGSGAGETWSDADAVIVATPAHEAARLLAAGDKRLAAELGGIEAVSAVTVSLGFRRSDVAHPLNGFGLVIPRREGRRIMGVTWSSSKFPGRAPADRVLFRVFAGGVKGHAVAALDDEHLLDVVRAELHSLLGVRGEPVITRLFRWERAMPQYNVGHGARLERIEAALRGRPGLHLAGGFYRGIGLPDAIASGRAAADAVLAGIGDPTVPAAD